MISVDLPRAREIEGMRTVELVCVDGLLRMSGKSLLLSMWRSIGNRFSGKEDFDVWVVRAVT